MLFIQLIYSLFLSLLCSSSSINIAPFSAYINTQPAIPKITPWLVFMYDYYPLIEVTEKYNIKLGNALALKLLLVNGNRPSEWIKNNL